VLLDELAALISERTRLVSVAWVSNALGTINPVREIVELAHARGVPVLIDACQAVQHLPIDVQALDCDFLVFSGHKLYGPSGIGALYGKEALLEAMPPYQGGGDMILSVSFAGTEFNELPYKFEAGTPAIEAAVGLGAAIDYVQSLGLDAIAGHEHDLMAYATRALNQVPGLRIIGTARAKSSVISFVLEQLHAHDVGTLLDLDGIAVRTGHHCAMPVMERFGVAATTRASFALYNTRDEIDALVASVRRMAERFG
jgi:cysteine desulfurase/selenocysteine lyase